MLGQWASNAYCFGIGKTMHNEKMSEETKKELSDTIGRMSKISEGFYYQAIQCGNHAFIEFCGLMNDYIRMCEAALVKEIDFRDCNTHSGNSLPMEIYQAEYLAGKLDCIYGAQLRKSEALRNAILEKMPPTEKKILVKRKRKTANV